MNFDAYLVQYISTNFDALKIYKYMQYTLKFMSIKVDINKIK